MKISRDSTLGSAILLIFNAIASINPKLTFENMIENYDVVCRTSNMRKTHPVKYNFPGALSLYEFDFNDKMDNIYIEDHIVGSFQISKFSNGECTDAMNKLHNYILQYI